MLSYQRVRGGEGKWVCRVVFNKLPVTIKFVLNKLEYRQITLHSHTREVMMATENFAFKILFHLLFRVHIKTFVQIFV